MYAVFADSTGRAMRNELAANPSADANGKRNPTRQRVFKTICLYVSYVTMVSQLYGDTF